MSDVYLDGKAVPALEITPERHRFLGMFRPAENPMANPKTDIPCTCGEILKYRGLEIQHYRKGCYDVPQYVTIGKRQE